MNASLVKWPFDQGSIHNLFHLTREAFITYYLPFIKSPSWNLFQSMAAWCVTPRFSPSYQFTSADITISLNVQPFTMEQSVRGHGQDNKGGGDW